MRDCRTIIFLTFVAASCGVLTPTFSWAAPDDEMKPQILREPIQNVSDPALTDAIHSEKRNDRIIRLDIAAIGGRINKKLDDGISSATGIGLDWRAADGNYWSFDARWMNTKYAWLEVGKKFLFETDSVYEPYYKLSVSHFMDPNDSLAGLTRIDSFKASASFGLLDMWEIGRLINFEIGSHWGIPGLAFHVQAGLQWTF
jgi:hypothetical protein